MTTLKSLAIIWAAAMLLFATNSLRSARSEPISDKYCTVEQVNPYTLRRIDISNLLSCKAVFEKSRTSGKAQWYTQIEGRVYWMQERTVPHVIELMEIVEPVAFNRLQSYLSGAYASDGNMLLYGARRVRTLDFPINPTDLRRFARYGIECSRYVTDGRLVLYEDRVLENADVASFELIAPPPAKEKSGPEFARDKSSVYYGADRIPDADPVSFQLVDFSHTGDAHIHGYYAVDRTHVWTLFKGVQLMTPEHAKEIRQRLQVSHPVAADPWKISRQLKVLGYALFLLTMFVLVTRLRARIKLRYQVPLFSRGVAVLSVAYLVIPSIGYLLLFRHCSEPDDIVVWSLLGSGLTVGAILLGIANWNFMHRTDAAVTTVVQLGIVAVALAIGTIPPGFVEGLKSIPAGVSRQCPSEHHTVTLNNRIEVVRLRFGIVPAEPVVTITSFRAHPVTR